MIATRVACWVVAVLFVVLLATGIALTFRYRPDVTSATANIADLERSPVLTARRVHQLASTLFLAAIGGLAISSIGLFVARRSRAFVSYPLLAGVAAVAASFTGYLLPWDQLALWAVTVGDDMQGYIPILRGDDVKFVIVGQSALGPEVFGRWFWVHAAVIPVVLVAMLAALVISARRVGDGREPAV